jgi:hypothetical protein
MANTYKLGGSPLGLINILSRPTRDNMSTFNAGKSRNVNVISYNRSRPQDTGVVQGGKNVQAPRSLFTGGSIPRFYANPDPLNEGEVDELGLSASSQFTNPASDTYRTLPSKIHNDRMYDMSLLNIIENLSKSPSAALRPGDFAYLKHLGVYPNNRLMICRRFGGPVGDNIFGKSAGVPKAVLIGWKPEDQDFLSFTFGEEWIEADADFTAVLNKMGQDFGLNNLGDAAGKAFNIIPLPGFTEVLQRQVLVSMGVLSGSSISGPLPSGNPNIIKQAKRRKTIGYGENASGLKCAISVKMEVEYEQKFISGIDPTIAFMDIVNNIVIFGTSRSDNYGLSSAFTAKLRKWMNDPGSLVNDILTGIQAGISKITGELQKAADKALKLLNDAVPSSTPAEPVDPSQAEADALAKNQDLVDKAKSFISGLLSKLSNLFKQYITKYKVEILGIANALSGAPSTPWHLTLGNPMRPFFCCGDMLAGDITLTFGPHLAFNDLPASIKAEFTLTNARPQGLQEILAKFNTGNLRVVNIKKDYIESNDTGSDKGQYFDPIFDASGQQLNLPLTPPPSPGLSGGSPSTTQDATTQTNAATDQLKKEKEELDKIKAEKGETSTEYTTAKAAYDKKVAELASQAQNTQKEGAKTEDKSGAPSGGNVNPAVVAKTGDEVNLGQGNASVLTSFTNQTVFTPPS